MATELADAALDRTPLCVDLDGTLTPSDTLHESLLRATSISPLRVLQAFGALFSQGKAGFKQRIADITTPDASILPYNEELLAWLREEKQKGRPLLLVTAAHSRIAETVARQLQLFDEVIATDSGKNLSGKTKAAALVSRFGERGFDYVGNDAPDLEVWRVSRRAVLVHAPRSLEQKAQKLTTVDRAFPRTGSRVREWVRALRVYQWVKNALVFVPLVMAHKLADPALLASAIGAFVAFCLCASSVYILNDLFDLESDRQHPRKRSRPFACGQLSAVSGIVATFTLLVAAFVIAFNTGWLFTLVLAVYYVITLSYSLLLKRISLIDVMSLASLYTLRILGGGAAVGVKPSFWLLALSMFLFLSLAVVKRYSELAVMTKLGKNSAAGRSYEAIDLSVLQSIGLASGYCATLVLALYINSPDSQALYRTPEVLWLTCPIMLYWVSRVWIRASRGMMHDDPIVFALKDRISLLLAAMTGVIAMLAL
jgi:4-hydroxybenzoate polyprenyltransferase/phosphoserine phosphatase